MTAMDKLPLECPLCEPIGGSGKVPKRLDLAWICDDCTKRLWESFSSPDIDRMESIDRGEPVASKPVASLVRGAFWEVSLTHGWPATYRSLHIGRN